MRGYKYGLLLVIWSCWGSLVVAAQAASGVAASAAVAIPSPEEDYEAGLKAREKDETTDAISLFYRAAQRGHAGAQAEMGYISMQGSAFKLALEYYSKSAAQNYPAGQLGLAWLYEEPGEYNDFAEARRLTTLAADQGYKPAIIEMAYSYIVGGLGLDENARKGPEALNWIKRAADVEYFLAIQTLADAYRLGEYGLKVDLKQADKWDAKYKEVTGIKEIVKKSKKRR